MSFGHLGAAIWERCTIICGLPSKPDALKDNISEAIDEIQLHTIDNVLQNWTDWPAKAAIWMKIFNSVFKTFSKKSYLAEPVCKEYIHTYIIGQYNPSVRITA